MYTPQDLLLQIHELGIGSVFVDGLTQEQYNAKIKLLRQQLKAIKQRLKSEQDDIKRNYDGRNQYESMIEKRELAPFNAIGDLISQLDIGLTDLSASLALKERIPDPPVFGAVIVEIGNSGSYQFVTLREARWMLHGKLSDKLSSDVGYIHKLREEANTLSTRLEGYNRAIEDYPSSPSNFIYWAIIAALCVVGIGLFVYGLALTDSNQQIIWALCVAVASFAWLLSTRAGRAKDEHMKGLSAMYAQQRTTAEQLQDNQSKIQSVQDKFFDMKAQLEKAQSLLNAKDYEQARQLLHTIPHPKAVEWLMKLDDMDV